MTGICGWWGRSVSDCRSVVGAMASQLSSFKGFQAESHSGARHGVAASAPTGTAAIVEHRGLLAALVGHARMEGANPATPLREVTSALLQAYLEDGEQAVRRLLGDFAVAILDPNSDSCLLAVDRSGVRNLVYQLGDGGIVFGSTCDAVLTHPLSSSSVDPQQIYNYVYFHMVPGPRTIYRDLQRILPGHYVKIEGGKLRQGTYWQVKYDHSRGADGFASLRKEFLDGLNDSVRTLALPDGCGAFLSGGTDSSTISGMLTKVAGKPAQTYSIGFEAEGYDEMEYARIAARHFGTDQHEYYVTPQDVVDTIPKVASIYDQPFGNASAIPTYHCARFAREHGIVRMLAGDGGDELFGGNARYAKQAQFALYDLIPAFIRHALMEPLAGILPQEGPALLRKARSYIEQASVPMPRRYEGYNLVERLGAETVFSAEFLRSIDPGAPHEQIAEVYFGTEADNWLNRILAVDLKFTLADNDLPKVTKMCELAGMDVAFPMLAEDVVAFSATLPADLKLKGTRLRYFFKEALRGFLPDEILVKQKHGFGLPVGVWLDSHAGLHEVARDALERLKGRGIFRPEFVDVLFSRYLKEHASYYGTLVWVLMMLELWFQNHGARAR